MESQGESSQSKRQNIEKPTTVLDLGQDILLGILSKIANESLEDIQNIELICKEFGKFANSTFVWQNLSLDNVPLFPNFHVVYAKRFFKFMKACRRAKNPEAIYRKGLINYFHPASQEKQQQKGLHQMRQASGLKNEEAIFVLGMILLCLGGENYDEGLAVLSPFLQVDTISTLRRKLDIHRSKVQNAWSWWGSNRGKDLKSTYSKRECNCDGRSRSETFGWDRNQPDGDLSIEEACQICIWDQEISKLVEYL